MVFGTLAVRMIDNEGKNRGFITTVRGKTDMEMVTAYVEYVDHQKLEIASSSLTEQKATLNAPLLDHCFNGNPEATVIVHYHEQYPGLPTKGYAPPGTVRDSQRDVTCGSFNIEGHGCILMFDSFDNLIVRK